MGNISEQEGLDVFVQTEITVPPDFSVVFYNDDYTPMDFVVSILQSVFHKSETDAEKLMLKVHKSGSSIIGTYPYDIAATRVYLTKMKARQQEFPLRVEMVKS